MGGKGESVRYGRLRARNYKQRDQLKKSLIRIIDRATAGLSVITLVNTGARKSPRRRRRR